MDKRTKFDVGSRTPSPPQQTNQVYLLLAVYLSANQIISSFTRCLFVYAFIRLCARALICLMFLLSVWVRICDYDWVKLT